MTKTSIGTIVGPSDESRWGQVLTSPQAYAVVEIHDTYQKARDIGVSLLSHLSRIMDTEYDGLSALQEAVKAVIPDQAATVLFVGVSGALVHIVLFGEGSVYIKRQERFATIIDKEGSISGSLQQGDMLLLVSKSFKIAISKEQCRSVFDHLSPVSIAERLTLLLHEHITNTGASALVLQVVQLNAQPSEEIQEADASYTSIAVPSKPSKVSGAKVITRLKPVIMLPLFGRIAERLKKVNRVILIAAFICITLFIVSVVVGVSRQFQTKQHTAVSDAVVEATHAYEEGVALLDLNPIKGRERLVQAKNILEPLAAGVSPKSTEGKNLLALLEQTNSRLLESMNIVRKEPSLFYDASLLKKDANISQMALYDGTLALFDGQTGSVFTLTLSNKSGQVAGGGQALRNSLHVAMHGDYIYLWSADGVHVLTLSNKQTTPQFIAPHSEWQTIADMAAFGGNLYLLDTGKSRIWKYVRGESRFAELSEYLNPDTLPDLSTATSIAIDGSVWIGTNIGKILRFTQGREDTFVPAGVDPGFGQELYVYTSDDVQNIYVLDKANKRIVVLEKTGTYLSQYAWESTISPTRFVVSEKQKKILLLIEGKLYVLELQ